MGSGGGGGVRRGRGGVRRGRGGGRMCCFLFVFMDVFFN